MSTARKFSYYVLFSTIASILLIIIGLFNLTSGLLLAVTHLVFLNVLVAGSIFETLYVHRKDQKRRRISLLLIAIFMIVYFIYRYYFWDITADTYVLMLLINIGQLFKYFN